MSSVVISNRSIFNQRIKNIEQNKVILPFNVNKEQTKKLEELLSKIKVTFLSEQDKLNISNLTYNGLNIKTNEKLPSASKFTLSKTYAVTMKQVFVDKVKTFYNRVVEEKAPERHVFSNGKETNLQQDLAEATTEIDLSAINASLNNTVAQPEVVEQSTPQVLANNPLGETVIENPVNLTGTEQPSPSVETPAVANQEVKNDVPVTPAQEPASTVVAQTAVTPEVPVQTQQSELQEQPKKKVKKKKFGFIAVPVVMVWLGAVFYGTLKLVTSILT